MSGTIIKTKFSTSNATPVAGSLSTGEQAYSFNSGKLYIGDATAGTTANDLIGGSYFTDKLVHALGTLTANSAILVDGSSKIDVINVQNITLTLNTISTTNANGHLILNPNGTGEVQVQATLAVVGNLTVSGTTTTTGGSTLGNISITGNTISAINPTNGDITLTPKGTGDVILAGTQTLMLPKGGNIGASTADTGKIRYNTVDNRFEGVVSGAWTGLGGVVDLDQDTKIIVEQASDDDTIRFFVGQSNVATEKGNINSTGLNVDVINELTANAGILLSDHVKIGNSTTNANLIVSGNLTVDGTTTSVNSTVTTLNDPIIKVGDGSATAGDNKDRGVSLDWGDGSAVKTGFFGMDMQTKRFSFKKDIGATDNQEYSAPWGDADFGSMYLSGSATIGTTLAVTGNATIGGTLGVTGIGTFSNNITVAGTTLSTGNLTVGASKFVVTAATGNTAIAGTTVSTGNLTVGASKFVVTAATGNTAISGLATIGGTLAVTGVSTLTGLLNANGGIAVVTNKFTVATSGNIVSAGTMNVVGAVDFDTTLNVDGAVTHKSTTHLGASAQMKIDATGKMTHGTIDGTGVTIDCGQF